MSDRPNALLTNSQRKKLSGEDSEEYTRQHRQRVRERTRNGTKDLSLLFKHMEERDIKQVFEPDREALSETADLIKEISSIVGRRGRRSSVGHRHILQEISHLIEEMQELEEQQADLRDDLDSINERNHGLGEWAESDENSMEEKRQEIESDLTNVRANREDIIEELQVRLEDYVETLREQVQSLEEGDKLLNQVPYNELSQDRQATLEKLRDCIVDERKSAKRLLEISEDVRSGLKHNQAPEEDLLYLRNEIQDRTHKRNNRKREEPSLHNLLRHLQRDIGSDLEKPEFDPELREDVVKSLAFFFRVSEVIGTSTEDLIEEAFLTMFDQEHPDEVLDHVVVATESENRDTAAERAASKSSDEHLSNAELRSLVDVNPDTLVERYSKSSEVTEAEIVTRIINEPDILEKGLEIEDAEPRSPGSAVVPDMVARDSNGQIVVVEFKTHLNNLNGVSERLQKLVQDYGGKERVRGMLVVPESIVEESEDIISRFGDRIEIRPISVRAE